MPRATPPSSLGDSHQTGLGTLAGSGAFGSGTPQTRPASSETGFGLVTRVTSTVTTRSATKATMAP